MQPSVLGKRTQANSDSSLYPQDTITPEPTPNPKRLKTSPTTIDVYPDCNKENVPPLIISPPPTPLRRATTSVISAHERHTPRRHSSDCYPITPATSLAHLSLATPPPTPPNSLTPTHVRARALLRSTSNGATPLSGRGREREAIMEFISIFLNSDGTSTGPSSLYISGSPGTGKTALVNVILTELDSSSFTVININCMALGDIESLWERINDEVSPLTSKKSQAGGKTRGFAATNNLLTHISKCILVLDELDHVITCSQSLKSLFSLSQMHSSRLRIIGIANTHTLTSSPSHLEHNGPTHVMTLHFSAYSAEQLLEILHTRLCPLFDDPLVDKSARQLLPTPALTLLTKKIASQTGDVRALFEALRSAIDISIAATQPKSNPLDCKTTVTPANILSALKAYSPASSTAFRGSGSSEVVMKVRSLGLHGRFVLLSLSLACTRLEAKIPVITSTNVSKSTRSPRKRTASVSHTKATVDIALLYLYYTALLSKGSDVFKPVSRSEFGDITNMLETVGLITSSSSITSPMKSSRKSFGRSSSFAGSVKSAGSAVIAFMDGIRMDEVMRGLGVEQSADSKANPDVKEEELRIIWEKEMREIRRETSAKADSKDVATRGFEDMSED